MFDLVLKNPKNYFIAQLEFPFFVLSFKRSRNKNHLLHRHYINDNIICAWLVIVNRDNEFFEIGKIHSSNFKIMNTQTSSHLSIQFYFTFLFSAAISTVAFSQNEKMIWNDKAEAKIEGGSRNAIPKQYRRVSVDNVELKNILLLAPMEQQGKKSDVIVSLPLADGTVEHFSIFESPIMAPELAQRYPEIKTYMGQGIEDPSATVRFDCTMNGLHAMIIKNEQTIFIEPYSNANVSDYIIYNKQDLPSADKYCEEGMEQQAENIVHGNSLMRSIGTELRTYRLAIAATAQYTALNGGTVASALAAIVTTMNQVNAIFEREMSIRMVLIANNDAIIFTDSVSDPFDISYGRAILICPQAEGAINFFIGNANYDIGHLFLGINIGGAAIGRVCNSFGKGQACSGFDGNGVGLVAHEMGHQFGAFHTFNSMSGSCSIIAQYSAGTAYEPGAGTTIMSYASNCAPDNTQMFRDLFFHTNSYEAITDYTIDGAGNSCAVITSTGNNPPVVNAGASGYTIPINTPFTLLGTGSDPNGDLVTYSWEQYDLGPFGPPDAPVGNAPLFRSFPPASTPSRTFPRLSDILNNTHTIGEILPGYSRRMSFRLTARDNHPGGGGVNWASMWMNVTSAGGEFKITSPNTNVLWCVGSTQTVTWDVANTNVPPVNCPTVNILLSIDGGLTFPIELAYNVPNDGSETITVPWPANINNARIKVEAVGNVFFDISDADFQINCPPPSPCSSVTTVNCGSGSLQTFTGGGSGSWNTASCGHSTPGSENVYRFVAPSTGTYSIQVTTASGFVDYSWKSASCSPYGWVCISRVSSPGQYGTLPMTAGVSYYILLDDEDNIAGTHNFYINCPPTDPCLNVTHFAGCGSAFAQTYNGGSGGLWNAAINNPCGYTSPGAEHIYSFTAPYTGTYSIQVTAASGWVDYQWQPATCSVNGWSCISDISSPGQYGSMTWTAGVTYYILLDDEDAIAGTHTFYINCPPFNPCSEITTIGGCGAAYPQTFSGGQSGVWNTSTVNVCGLPSPGKEHIYSFIAPLTGIYRIRVTVANGWVDYQWQASSCSPAGWNCIQDLSSTGQWGALSWTAGITYYILLDDEDNTAGTHTFYIDCPQPCAGVNITDIEGYGSFYEKSYIGGGIGEWNTSSNNSCGVPAPGRENIYRFVAPITGNYSLQVTSASGWVDYQLKSSSCSETGWSCIARTNTSGQYGNFAWTAGTTYYILLDDEDNVNSNHRFYINGPDPCANITAIGGCGSGYTQTYTGGLSSKWYTAAVNSCGWGGNGIEKIYSFIAPVTGTYSFQTIASSGILVSYQWKSSSCSLPGWTCGALVVSPGQYGSMAWTAGTTYYILLDGVNQLTGYHSFYINCPPVDPCLNVTSITGCGTANSQTYTGGSGGIWNAVTSNGCGFLTVGIEKIYSYVAPTTGTYSIQVTSASGYTDYQWRSSCTAGIWNCIADVYYPGQYGAMNWIAGTTYYILLDDEDNVTGTHTFYINCGICTDPPDPVSNSPKCENVTITRAGIPSSGQTWYWQGTSCGTSTELGFGPKYGATASGTYYIRSYNSAVNCWSAGCGSVTVTVNPAPAAPQLVTATPSSICIGESSNLNATATGDEFGFTGFYDVSNWTPVIGPGGIINTSDAPSSVSITSGNSSEAGSTFFKRGIISLSGVIKFTWNYSTTDGAIYDYPQLIINGVTTLLPGFNTGGANIQSGTCVIPIAGGETFSLCMFTSDGLWGAGTTVFSNLSAPIANTINWYTVAIDGTIIGNSLSGADIPFSSSALGTVDYYAEAVSAAACVSTGRTAATVTTDSCMILRLVVLLQGLYVSGHTMTATLYNLGLNSDPTASDSIIVELHDQFDPSVVVQSIAVLLHIDGSAIAHFPYAVFGGTYYIAIHHRNSIATWSKLPVTLGLNTIFDFAE